MLIDFSVENFRSFGGEQTHNLVASKKLKDHRDHCVPIGTTGKNVLRTAVVYGANAAGKSNLVRAIYFAQSLVVGTDNLTKLALNQFRFCKKKSPSSFEFRFLVNEQIFVYGFTVNQKSVVEEWLAASTGTGKEIDIFSRSNQQISVGNLKAFGEDAAVSEKALKAFQVLGPRPDQLLLNKIVDLPESSRGDLLHRAAWWVTDCLTVVQSTMSYAPLLHLLDDDSDFRRFASEFLSSVGTGINDLEVEQSEIKTENLPNELLQGLEKDATILLGNNSVSLQVDPNDPNRVMRRHLAARHKVENSTYSVPFQEESDGTFRCLNLLPALYHLTTACKVFVIDELDRSLHPLLSHALLRFFVTSCPGACQQMIVTTHETHLLDLDLLRRDEIWFVEKDRKQQTQIYSMADLNVRKDVRIEKGYLQGRFGGIPFIGDQKRLMDLIHCATNGVANEEKASS